MMKITEISWKTRNFSTGIRGKITKKVKSSKSPKDQQINIKSSSHSTTESTTKKSWQWELKTSTRKFITFCTISDRIRYPSPKLPFSSLLTLFSLLFHLVNSLIFINLMLHQLDLNDSPDLCFSVYFSF
jgi:hypothetical protein